MARPTTRPGGRRPRKRERKNVVHGVAHIKSSFNNTIVSITDHEGATAAPASTNAASGGLRKLMPSRIPTPAPGRRQHGVHEQIENQRRYVLHHCGY